MSEMKIRPLHDRVIVRTIESETVTQGGIFLPDTAAEKPSEGIVLAIGTGKVMPSGAVVPVDLAVGDKVMFGQYVGQEIKVDNETFLILTEEEIIGVLV